jgi:uncharacterized protein with ParB-like and HNH nuclease domain
VYQREYVWDKKQFSYFLNSLLDNSQKYYNSYIVYAREPGRNAALELIDGQQRITSIYIVLLVLRKISIDYEWSKATNELHRILFNDIDGALHLKLKGITNDFLEHLTRNPIPNIRPFNESQIFENFYFALSNIKVQSENDVLNFIDNLNNKKICEIIVESTDNIDNNQLFGEINSSGMVLCNFELIINLALTGKTVSEQQEFYRTF